MKGNAIVIILPVVVMIGLFLFGYMSISQKESITNEDLQQLITITATEMNENTVEVNWQWGDFPEEGIQGNDYIELFLSEGEKNLNSVIERIEVSLWQGNQIVYESTEFFLSDKGIVIPIPNEMQDEQILGPSGQVTLHFPEYVNVATELRWRYYHTWEEHTINEDNGINMEDRFIDEQIQSYWSVIGNL
ncbi:hypothetical protein CR203_01415 [Salipaludibacillus neizhouensis]|uniref:Uncharacterized protein n=1 Tax=Salipaludibacillus neizhouensis TaxID=885475 RepID=A0A3A9KVV0_9BACI|nr:hypothetical protein [Salipaludibacillus neizhouensis]RKL68736.1 hypothetical protein CR203_01415 [Salipaludibacillus neizhouensis]